MKWTREEYLDLMTFGDTPRPMFSELFGPLIGSAEEWRAQGASEDEIKLELDRAGLPGSGKIQLRDITISATVTWSRIRSSKRLLS